MTSPLCGGVNFHYFVNVFGKILGKHVLKNCLTMCFEYLKPCYFCEIK
jgi:hypothetical protein